MAIILVKHKGLIIAGMSANKQVFVDHYQYHAKGQQTKDLPASPASRADFRFRFLSDDFTLSGVTPTI